MWAVRGEGGTFYTSVLRQHGESQIVRFNRICMRPVSRAGAEAGETLARALLVTTPVAHQWRPGQALLLDNWRMLHARPAVTRNDAQTRRLERVLVSIGDAS